MHSVTITFNRVFDIARGPVPNGQSDKFTTFSFEANGVTRYGVEIPGWPPIETGMTVTALLENDGDWHSLLGWVDHSTNSVVSAHYLTVLLVTIGAAVLFLLPPWGASLALIAEKTVVGIATLAGVHASLRTWRAQNELRRILKTTQLEKA